MKKLTTTIILALATFSLFSQRTEERATTIQAPKGITIGGEKVDSLTFHGSDSITFYSGANSVVAGGTSSGGGGAETDPVYNSEPASSITAQDLTDIGNLSGTNTGDQDLSGLNDSIYFETFAAWYGGNDTIPDDSLRSFVQTYLNDSGVVSSIRDTIYDYLQDSGQVATLVYAGDTSNYPTPDFTGQELIDTANSHVYRAFGTSRGDWKRTYNGMIVWLACFFRVRIRKNKKV